jgi:hypothetical protein
MAGHETGPEPVKLIVALLWSDAARRDDAVSRMCSMWGMLDYEGPDHPFDRTYYYEAEMGKELKRRLIGFARLVSPEILTEAKRYCNGVENDLRESARRRVNLDVGYLDHCKVVLASVKSAGQKIYLSRGIYADLVARYARGRYQPFEWTFPDFKDGRYDADLAELRRLYLEQR